MPGKMGRPPGHGDIVDKIRGAAKLAMARLEEKPHSSLADIIEKCFEERPLDTLNALAKWAPPSLKVDHNHSVDATGSAEEIQRAASILAAVGLGRSSGSVQGNGEDRPVLPAAASAESTRH